MDGIQLGLLGAFFVTALLHIHKERYLLPAILFVGYLGSILIYATSPLVSGWVVYLLVIALNLVCIVGVGRVSFTPWHLSAIQGCFAVDIFMSLSIMVEYLALGSSWVFEHQLWPVRLANIAMCLLVFDRASFTRLEDLATPKKIKEGPLSWLKVVLS